MQEYDLALKQILMGAAGRVIRHLTGGTIERWLNVELPEVRGLRADLLGENKRGELIHIELQSTNDPAMEGRMLEYCAVIYRRFRKLPRQSVLYVGEEPMRMESGLIGPRVQFSYETVDIRAWDGEEFLESEDLGDNVVAILAHLEDRRYAVPRLLSKIAALAPDKRSVGLQHLLILAGLRSVEQEVEQEARKMPLLNDIMDNKVLGREYKKGLAEGELIVLRRQIEKRFGPIPGWAAESLARRSAAELEELSVRVLDAPSIEDLLR